MSYDDFITKLIKLYNKKDFPVRFFLQSNTFSYEIHHRDTAFTGKPLFESEVYWHDLKSLSSIYSDVTKERARVLKTYTKEIKQFEI